MNKLKAAGTKTVPMGEIKNLHKVKKDEIGKAASVLADSFKKDPLFEKILGSADNNLYKYSYMSLWRMINSGSIFPFFRIGFKSLRIIADALSPIDEVRKKHMKNRSHAYLQIIGVASEDQGKGHGSKLIKELTALTDEVKIPIYLETETEVNVKIYEHFGFKVLEQMNLAVIDQPMWAMIREVNADH